MKTISDHFERILVPVDFSPASDEDIAAGKAVLIGDHHLEFATASLRSIELAAALARASGGRIRMVHATPAMQTSTIYTGPITLPTAIIDEIHAKARQTSTDALEALAKSHCSGVPVDFAVRPGPPVVVVLDEAVSFDADLVVMAASGRSGVARFFVGSTADRVIRQAQCPVLVIPAEHREG